MRLCVHDKKAQIKVLAPAQALWLAWCLRQRLCEMLGLLFAYDRVDPTTCACGNAWLRVGASTPRVSDALCCVFILVPACVWCVHCDDSQIYACLLHAHAKYMWRHRVHMCSVVLGAAGCSRAAMGCSGSGTHNPLQPLLAQHLSSVALTLLDTQFGFLLCLTPSSVYHCICASPPRALCINWALESVVFVVQCLVFWTGFGLRAGLTSL